MIISHTDEGEFAIYDGKDLACEFLERMKRRKLKILAAAGRDTAEA